MCDCHWSMCVSRCVTTQGGLTQSVPHRISNKKYDDELLSRVVKDALTIQGIPEAYEWLEEAVKQQDIPVGRALELEIAPGALGRLHEVGAGARVAAVQVIHPSPYLDDMERFWSIPQQARPLVFAPVQGLPDLRYSRPVDVPAHLLPAAEPADEDDVPLLQLVAEAKRKRGGGKAAKRKPRKKKKSNLDDPALRVTDVCAGKLVLTHDNYGEEGSDRWGYSVCKIVGDTQGTDASPCWRYKLLATPVSPWKKATVDAKFGTRGMTDGGSARVHFYSIVSVFERLNANGSLPAHMKLVMKQHPDWASLEEDSDDAKDEEQGDDESPSEAGDSTEDECQPYAQIVQ